MADIIGIPDKADFYQELVDDIRRREDFFKKFDGGWPGRYGHARSEYPNLAAELVAREWQIDTPAEAAKVSREVMAGVIENGELLSIEELERIADRLGIFCNYLSSPVLSLVDPATSKGRYRTAFLREMLKAACRYNLWGVYLKNAEITLRSLEQGRPVTYAAWRWPCKKIMFETGRQWNRQKAVRTERIATA